MTKSSDPDEANELSAEDLDMAVGGASLKDARVFQKEEAKKFVKGEENNKHDLTAREEKQKHQ